MSELEVADPEGAGHVDTILVCVAPPDGIAIASTLRDRGFAVVESQISMLGARAALELPQVMIVDLELPGADDVLPRAREAAPRAELLSVVDPGRAEEHGLSRTDGRAFERPVDLDALLLAVVALAEPAVPPHELGEAPRPGPARGPNETIPPGRARESDAPASEYPSTSDPLEIAAILPAFDDPSESYGLSAIEVSPELAELLESAEQRANVVGVSSRSSIPSPDEEPDVILPAEMLAVLDEPLSPEDEAIATGGSAQTGGHTGYSKLRTTGERPPSATPPPTTSGTGPDRFTSPEATRGSPGSAMPPPVTTGPATLPPSAPPPPPTTPPPARITTPPEPFGERAISSPAASLIPLTTPFVPSAQGRAIFPSTQAPEPSAPARAIFAPAPAPEPSSAGRGFAPAAAAPVPAPASASTASDPAPPGEPALPQVLTPGDAIRALATAIAGRASGALALGTEAAMRRIVLHDGDVVTAASTAPDEALVAFLAARGDLEREVASRLAGRLPAFGRHAGAALIAHGHLGQDDLWPVLRAHAEWIIGRALTTDEGTCELEAEPPGRLKAEPNVFGGATGAEVMLEAIRRVVPPRDAERRIGGLAARLGEGPRHALLAECALSRDEEAIVRSAPGRTVSDVLANAAPELADVLYGLVALGVLEALAPARRAEPKVAEVDPLDEEALRQRVRARLSLVEDGDYFALLGIPRGATGYEIRRAYLELRRAFEPGRVLTAATADLAGDVQLVIEVLDEAYDILREPHRRERYRRAIEAGPP